MILWPAKTKSMLLATRRKRQLRPLHLHLSLKDSHIEEFHGVIIDDEFRWRSHIIGTCKSTCTVLKKKVYLLFVTA